MKSEKKVNTIVITLIILLVIGAVFLLIYQKQRYKDIYFKYNGFDVHKVNTKNGIFYYVKIFLENNPQPYLINVRHDPRTLEDIPL